MTLPVRAVRTYREEGLGELATRTRDVVVDRTFPRVPDPLRTVRWYLGLRRTALGEEYRLGDPFRLRTVDPAEIEYVSGLTQDIDNQTRLYWGRTEAGDWDRTSRRFVNRPIPRSLRLHFERGIPWEETPLREVFDERVQTRFAWGHSSPGDFGRRTAEIERLYERIRRDGYASNRVHDRDHDSGSDAIPAVLDEVTIDVGRTGEPLWREFGQHRLAIAKLLDVDEIPVLVGAVHEAADDVSL